MEEKPGKDGGKYGIASEIDDLTGQLRSEVEAFLRSLTPQKIHTTKGGYVEYKFSDKSKLWIRPNGEIVRIPKPEYDETGRQINKGARLDPHGNLTDSHNTGERVKND